MDWIHLAQDWCKNRAIEITEINFRIAWNMGNFMTRWKSVCVIAWSISILLLVRNIRLIFNLLFINWLDEIRKKKNHRKIYRVGLNCISPALIKIKHQTKDEITPHDAYFITEEFSFSHTKDWERIFMNYIIYYIIYYYIILYIISFIIAYLIILYIISYLSYRIESYHIISYIIYHIISYHILYHIISYYIILLYSPLLRRFGFTTPFSKVEDLDEWKTITLMTYV